MAYHVIRLAISTIDMMTVVIAISIASYSRCVWMYQVPSPDTTINTAQMMTRGVIMMAHSLKLKRIQN